MKMIPIYFFIALFIGFFMIYVFKNDYFVIMKNKKCIGDKAICHSQMESD